METVPDPQSLEGKTFSCDKGSERLEVEIHSHFPEFGPDSRGVIFTIAKIHDAIGRVFGTSFPMVDGAKVKYGNFLIEWDGKSVSIQ